MTLRRLSSTRKSRRLITAGLGLLLGVWMLFGTTKQDNSFIGHLLPNTVTVVHAEDPVSDAFPTVVADISKDPSKFGISDGSKAGVQWSQLASENGFFGQATKSSFSLMYGDLLPDKDTTNQGRAASYGMALGQTGLDHSVMSGFGEDTLNRMGRLIGGGLLLLGYALNSIVFWLFRTVTSLANELNVMNWMTTGKAAHTGLFGDKLDNMAALFKSSVDLVNTIGMIGMTILIIVTIAMAVMGWRFTKSSPKVSTSSGLLGGTMRIGIRLFMMLIVPLFLAWMFAGMMNAVTKSFEEEGDTAGTYAIYSNMVDFQGWMEHSRLALPKESKNGDDKLTGILPATASDSLLPVITHAQILNVNAYGAGRKTAQSLIEDEIGQGNSQTTSTTASKASLGSAPISMIQDWMNGAGYGPSDWSSFVRSRMPDGTNTSDKDKMKAELESAGDDGNFPYVTNGTLSAGGDKAVNERQDTYGMFTTSNPPTGNAKMAADAATGGISTVGMYNYLSTVFNAYSMKWTASTALLNFFTAPEHKVVGVVGRGPLGFSHYTLAFSLIWALAISGLMFVMIMISSLIAGVPKIFGYAIANGFGSLVYGIKLIVAVFTIVIEVGGTAVLYDVTRTILVTMAGLTDKFFVPDKASSTIVSRMLTSITGTSSNGVAQASTGSSMVAAASDIGISILLFWMAFKLVKARGPILTVFTKMAEDTMNTVFGTFDYGSGGNGAMSSDRFAPGGAGLNTTNANGENQMQSLKDGMTPGGNGSGGGSDYNGTGGGTDMSRGAQNRRSRIGNPSTLAGKGFNLNQSMKDAASAKEGKLGRSLTGKERFMSGAKYLGTRAAAGAIGGAAATMGSNKLAGVASDMRSIQDNSIDNGLSKKAENQEMMDKLANGGSPSDMSNAGMGVGTNEDDARAMETMADEGFNDSHNDEATGAAGAMGGEGAGQTPERLGAPEAEGPGGAGQSDNGDEAVGGAQAAVPDEAGAPGVDNQNEGAAAGGVGANGPSGESAGGAGAGEGNFGGQAVPGAITGTGNNSKGTAGVAMPKSASESDRRVKMATSNLQQANLAAQKQPNNPAVKERQAAAKNTLQAHRMNATKLMGQQTAPANLTTGVNSATGQKPTIRETRQAVSKVANVQKEMLQASKANDMPRVKALRNDLSAAQAGAKNAGISPAAYKSPKAISQTMSQLTATTTRAINGEAASYAQSGGKTNQPKYA